MVAKIEQVRLSRDTSAIDYSPSRIVSRLNMSYYFTCVALESGPIALPDGFTSHSLSTELLLVW